VHIIDLNHAQKKYSLSGNASLSYSPKDFFNVTTYGNYGASRAISYSAKESDNWSWGAKVAFRVFKDLDIWFTTQGDLSASEFSYENGYCEQYRTAMLLETLSIKY